MAMISCPECNKDISDKAKSCPHCGSPVTKAVAVIACSECGKEVPGKAKSCPHCGNPISGGADEAKAAAARAADAVTKALTAGGKSAFWVGFLMASWGGFWLWAVKFAPFPTRVPFGLDFTEDQYSGVCAVMVLAGVALAYTGHKSRSD